MANKCFRYCSIVNYDTMRGLLFCYYVAVDCKFVYRYIIISVNCMLLYVIIFCDGKAYVLMQYSFDTSSGAERTHLSILLTPECHTFYVSVRVLIGRVMLLPIKSPVMARNTCATMQHFTIVANVGTHV